MLRLYSLYDSVARLHKNVFLANTDGEAVRAVLPQLCYFNLNINSADLFYVGDWSEETGKVEPVENPVRVAWNTFDYEQKMNDVQLQACKNAGSIPSDEKFMNASTAGKILTAIGKKLGVVKDAD